VTALAGKLRRELNAMIFPQIQSDPGLADVSAVVLNLREDISGAARNGDTLVASILHWATGVSPFQRT
jgi:hypothetical protein